jgi:hypothetical protein
MRITISILFSFMLLVLSACADTEWPQWISGEPTKEQLNAYKGPIPMPNPGTQGKEWPNLADVPHHPKVTLSEEKKDLLVAGMKDDNMEGLHEIEAYNKTLQPVVTVTPKKPVKKPVQKHKKKTHKKKVTHDAQ